MTSASYITDSRKVKFGEVVRLSRARSKDPLSDGLKLFVGLEHLEPGDLRIRSWGNVADGTTFTNRFEPGQVLFGKRRAYQRKVALADFSGVCSGDIYVLESKDAKVLLPELLPFICQTDAFFDHAVGTSAGSLSPRTNWKSLETFEFALPPMEEQQRLLDLYRAIEKNLIALGAACEAAVTLENSKLETALDSISDERFLPVLKLVSSGPRNGLSPKVNSGKKGYPTLSIGAVRGGQITAKGNTKYAEITKEQAGKFALKKDDVLIVRGNGNKQLTGKCGIVGTVPKGCFYPDLLIRLQFDEEIIRPKFASLQWNAPRTHQRLVSRAKSTNGIWKINGKDISQHTLKVPSIEEQDTLLEEIKTIQQARSDLEERKKKVQTLKALALKKIEQGEGVCLSTKPTQ